MTDNEAMTRGIASAALTIATLSACAHSKEHIEIMVEMLEKLCKQKDEDADDRIAAERKISLESTIHSLRVVLSNAR